MHLTFGSRKTNSNEISNIIDDLNIEKACQNSDVPTKIININNNNIAPFLSENCNSSNDKGEFPNDLKYASIVPVQKSKSKTNNTNCRPISLLFQVIWKSNVQTALFTF